MKKYGLTLALCLVVNNAFSNSNSYGLSQTEIDKVTELKGFLDQTVSAYDQTCAVFRSLDADVKKSLINPQNQTFLRRANFKLQERLGNNKKQLRYEMAYSLEKDDIETPLSLPLAFDDLYATDEQKIKTANIKQEAKKLVLLQRISNGLKAQFNN